MLNSYPKFKRGEIEKIYKKLPAGEKKIIEDFLFWRKARGLGDNAANDLRRYLIQVRHIIQCDYKEYDSLDKVTRLSVLINHSYLSNTVKPNLRINLKNFFKFLFPDWSSRFRELDCFDNRRIRGQGSEKGKVSEADLPTDEEIENMLKSEHDIFWKTFLLYQASTGLRTIEARTTEVKNIKFNDDGTTTIEIFMTKTGNPKIVFTDLQTTEYIKKLIAEQKNAKELGKYLFHSPANKNKPIHKNSVNKWFKNLSIAATGRHLKPYYLRHKKATELYKLAKENKIAENTALRLMGHSRSLMERYDHTPTEKEIEILKSQAFITELSEEKRSQLEQELEMEKKERKKQGKEIENLKEEIKSSKSISHKLVDAEAKIKMLFEMLSKNKEQAGKISQ